MFQSKNWVIINECFGDLYWQQKIYGDENRNLIDINQRWL